MLEVFGRWPVWPQVSLGGGGGVAPNPLLSALGVWRADEALAVAGVTTTLVPIVGAVSLARNGTGQLQALANVNLNSQFAVPFDGVAASGGYFGVPFAAAPVDCTVLTVARLVGAGAGFTLATVGGVLNTGFGQLSFGGFVRSRKMAADPVTTNVVVPINLVWLSMLTAAGATHYVNSFPAAAGAFAGALAGTTLEVGAFDSLGAGTMSGAWALSAVWARLLTATEVARVLAAMGSRYGVTIAP